MRVTWVSRTTLKQIADVRFDVGRFFLFEFGFHDGHFLLGCINIRLWYLMGLHHPFFPFFNEKPVETFVGKHKIIYFFVVDVFDFVFVEDLAGCVWDDEPELGVVESQIINQRRLQKKVKPK